ncbi:Lar family restriction alleviation protein [Marinobacterium jannaschii]|uniref:Lar family restriction alleviation protein n=1 Tax=Marinobacterium jannaschii TaxID=64970 RepID=UPI0004826334|nr:Lar family restriction alleviation protein [Marinobacterium jannaschii]
MSNQKLKPCPFCGGEAELIEAQYPYVECTECGISIDFLRNREFDHKAAVDKWNARHIPEGYVLVPVEPTKAMFEAVTNDDQGAKGLRERLASDSYKAMVRAAQESSQCE